MVALFTSSTLFRLHSFIHSFVHSFCSCLTTVHTLFQNEFSTECGLVLPLLISSIIFFPEGHLVAAYIFFLVFPSLLSFCFSFINVF